jgi:phosphoribosylaminoimidazole-succinocarboxamide synthase
VLDAVWTTDLPGLPPPRRGKVRDVYDLGETLLLVATDRLSAYDHVLRPPIPGKGKVLTQLSSFWFERLGDLVPNHLLATDPADFPADARRHAALLAGRAVLVRKTAVVPFECVARGYLAGSGFREYRETGRVCGIELPPGLELASRLPGPIFTPATKAVLGHDENVDFATFARGVEAAASPADGTVAWKGFSLAREGNAEAARAAGGAAAGGGRGREEGVAAAGAAEGAGAPGDGGPLAEWLRQLTLELYDRAGARAAERGLILADTKFEFGLLPAGEGAGPGGRGSAAGPAPFAGRLLLIDEALTPDSSRYWDAAHWQPGEEPASFDKQFVRNWLDSSGWDHQSPPPELPPDVVLGTQQRYLEAFRRLTGREPEL